MGTVRSSSSPDGDSLYAGKIIHCLDALRHAVGNFGADLAAVLPVSLEAVVLLRIMGCSDVDAGDRAELPDHIRQLRCGPHVREGIDPDPCPRKDLCGKPGKLFGTMPRVVGDDHALLHGLRSLLADEIRDPLSRAAHGVAVHAAGPGAEDPPEPGGAECDVLHKTLPDQGIVPLHFLKFPVQRILLRDRFQPQSIFFQVIHSASLFLNLFICLKARPGLPA